MERILITGGCGFIGANFIRYILKKENFQGQIINIDALTYAGNPQNLADIISDYPHNYTFEKCDIRDTQALAALWQKHQPDAVVHFAAESHVDRSILGPRDFIETNINGTFNLLELAKHHWQDKEGVVFHHVSTDEVYGSLGATGYFFEHTAYDPRSPYSASKAAADHLVKAYYHTYNLPITLSNCSNNYGPYQFPEKLIPLMIINMLEGKPLPVYGDGMNVRDWLHVDDHCRAIWQIMQGGKRGETYNVGGENEYTNIDLLNLLCEIVAQKTDKAADYYKQLITYIKDRQGHDRRYAINCDKLKNDLGFTLSYDFSRGIDQTVDWYINNPAWIKSVKTGEYQNWLDNNYTNREN